MNIAYQIIFKIILFFPALGFLNTILMNKKYEIQKIINNAIYAIVVCGLFFLVLGYKNDNIITWTILNLDPDIAVTFQLDAINLTFAFFLSLVIFFFNEVFQNYFNNLNLTKKYQLYNQSLSVLFSLFILAAFSHNIVISIFIYMLIMFNSMFLIKNPELKELKRDYTLLFIISISSCMIFTVMCAFYKFYSNNLFFVVQSLDNDFIFTFWIMIILFLLILIYFMGPIYVIFRRKLYYEDFLPLFTILIFPFIIINTFLFIKILYYVFINNFSNLGLYFYYTQYLLILIFSLGCFMVFKNIKNNIKFIILFVMLNYIVFLSQILLAGNEVDLLRIFSNFLFFVMSTVGAVLLYSGILFLLLRTGIKETKILYAKSKIEANFYIFSMFLPIVVNLISFFSLDFENFNVFYLINLAEIVVLVATVLVYNYFAFGTSFTKVDISEVTLNSIDILERIKFFKTQVMFIILFLVLFIFKGFIFRFLVN